MAQMPEGTARLPSDTGGEWGRDLNPDFLQGQNSGAAGPHPEKAPSRTAYDEKRLHSLLRDFNDADLKQIPIMPEGSLLEEGATYIDLYDPTRGEFRTAGNVEVTQDHAYVPKTAVDYQLWNRLTGVRNPEWTGQADEPGLTPR